MRIIIIVIIFLTGIPVVLTAQIKKVPVQIPEVVKANFYRKYPHTKAKWERNGALYEASFISNGRKNSVLYNESGQAKETAVSIAVAGLPQPALQYIDHKKLGKIITASKIAKTNGGISYEVEIKGKDYLFDQKGAFLGEEQD